MQLSIFNGDVKWFERVVSSNKLPLSVTPVTTLKKREIVNLRIIEERLYDKVGTLYLHQLRNVKENESYENLCKKIYKSFFSSLVENIESEDCRAKIEEILSDSDTVVRVYPEEGRFSQMVRGAKGLKSKAFYLELKSKDLTVTYLTGTDFKSISKHKRVYYFKNDKSGTSRTLGDVRILLAELLLLKELKHYYAVHEQELSEVLKSVFTKHDVVYCDERLDQKVIKLLDEFVSGENKLTKMCVSPSIYHSITGFFGGAKALSLGSFYEQGKTPFVHTPTGLQHILCRDFVSKIMTKIQSAEYHLKTLKNSTGEYASSYEMKKNIPLKTKEAMESSSLKKYFVDVEYDEKVDLKLIKQFEAEISMYIESFGLRVPPNGEFKVRRLGKHRAAGLYFATCNTLVVDIEHPESFVHEFMHMIDYRQNSDVFTGERLSDEREFEPLAQLYKKIVSQNMNELPEDSLVRQKFHGSNKYNKDYYFDSTEIFARCGEIYFAKLLGNSSLTKVAEMMDNSPYYPKDRLLNQLIETYFERVVMEE